MKKKQQILRLIKTADKKLPWVQFLLTLLADVTLRETPTDGEGAVWNIRTMWNRRKGTIQETGKTIIGVDELLTTLRNFQNEEEILDSYGFQTNKFSGNIYVRRSPEALVGCAFIEFSVKEWEQKNAHGC